MAVNTTETIQGTVIEIVKDLVQDWGVEPEGGIAGSTRLAADLEFASVDIIQLCVAIEQHYGQKIGFQDLLMKNGSYVSDLSLTQIAEFVAGKIRP
jgi:acyl carrier protein